MFQYFVLYKPYGFLSQFTQDVPGQKTLSELNIFPSDVYPVGRLDKDSEGLLLLTDDKALNHRLLNPDFKHWRTYWVQVEGNPKEEQIEKLCQGVEIRVRKKKYRTLPTRTRVLPMEPELPERDPPIRFRKTVPDTWLEMKLQEGKNRQVRRMCAKVGLPVLRLVRTAIEDLKLGNLQVGEVRSLKQKRTYQQLHIPIQW